MLTLRLELLMGQYVASAFNDRNRVEWPPHPARVFSALVAACHEAGAPADQRNALQWLERQPAPRLAFSPASERDLKTFYVPVNDQAVSDASMVDNAWEALRAPDLTDKQRAKAEARLATAYEKTSAEAPKLPKNVREIVAHVLPATRTKQPRTFPVALPEDPTVWLSWEAEPEPEILASLRALAAQVVRLGHSSSLVAARWTDEDPAPCWQPDDDGPHVLRWVGPGQLAALEALHAAAPYSEQRVMPYVVARYREGANETAVASSRFSTDLIVLRRVDGPRLPILASEALVDGVRRALMSHAEQPVAPLLSGHEPDGAVLQEDHLAVVPLSFVGSPHASGDLLGVALVPPAGLDREQLRPLYAAIASWEAAGPRPGDGPRSTLVLGSLGRWVLERSLDPPTQYNLQERTWTGPSRCWASVTPVVLDRHPGSLGDPRPAKRRRAVGRANAVIEAACRRIGLPPPVRIELDLAPFFRGSEPARRFPALEHGDRRPAFHVHLTFAQPVRGPVLLGAGRYRGLGVLRPVGGEAS